MKQAALKYLLKRAKRRQVWTDLKEIIKKMVTEGLNSKSTWPYKE